MLLPLIRSSRSWLCTWGVAALLIMINDIGYNLESFIVSQGGIQDLFYKAAGILPELAFTKGDTWKRARQTMSPSFSAMKIKKVE